MQILDNLIIVGIHVLCFVAGVKLANFYNRKERQAVKEALERQFVRLRVRADADDPCKPYVRVAPTGDFDGDNLKPIPPEFLDQLKQKGFAKTSFRKSDLTK